MRRFGYHLRRRASRIEAVNQPNVTINLQQTLNDRVESALHKFVEGEPPAVVVPAGRPEFGDYQVNGIMGAAKRVRTNPRELAATVLDELELNDLAESIEIAGPGFLNIRLNASFLSTRVTESTRVTKSNDPKRVVVDYSSPNLAKEMHVGHLRSTVIGDAVARTLELAGHTVIRQNHIGDWGTAFGRLLAYLDDVGDEAAQNAELRDIEALYVEASQKFETDPDFADRSRSMVLALQSHEPDAIAKWEHFMTLAQQHMSEIYSRLDVSLRAQDTRGESAYNAAIAPMISDLQKQGNVLEESEGALCIFMPEFKNKDGEIQPMIVQKSDGGYLYHTTDLAALRYRQDSLHADRVLYFTDARQILHFEMLFAASRLAKIVEPSVMLEHHPFGKILGKDGKPFKTRSGDNILLRDLLDEALDRATSLIREKTPGLDDKQRSEIAHAVAVGAVKYADLSKNRLHDYTFDWNEMLAFDGNTAPYLQYAYARISSVFEKGNIDSTQCSEPPLLDSEVERQLAVHLLRFQEVVEQVVKDAKPHYLCSYLYELTVRFMRFYEQCPILSEEPPIRNGRLTLCSRTATTLKTGLGALGIRVLARM